MNIYPDLNKFRRTVVPWFERNEETLFDRDIMFTKEAQTVSYVGVIEGTDVDTVVDELCEKDNTYATNLACLKYVTNDDGERIYERASYSYRPDGFFGKYQYHFRLWPHSDGVAVWAHYELNPWHSPRKHYAGNRWNPHEGVKKAHEYWDIDTSAKITNVTN